MTGRFIAFEGGDACGKSTQAGRLASQWQAVLTREPGGTVVSEKLRELLLDPDGVIHPRTEALILAAARAQHVADVIAPTLAEGTHVVTDRFTGSSLAYQGYGRGLGVEAVAALSEFATDGLWPDLNVLIDLPVDVAMQRLDTPPDRFESEAMEFKEALRAGYLELAAADPNTWVVIDGSGTVEEVSALVDAAVTTKFG